MVTNRTLISLLALTIALTAIGLELDKIDPVLAALQVAAMLGAGFVLWRTPSAPNVDVYAALERIETLEDGGKAQDAAMIRVVGEHAAVVREIHHRVKNNLQIVYSLLDLQISRLKSDEARQALAATRARVRALALVHRHLYDDKDFHSVEMRAFVTELCDHLNAAEDGRSQDRIRMTVTVDDTRLVADQAVALGLIITEAALNARQHAFVGEQEGTIKVSLAVTAGAAVLTIADDGLGVTPPTLAAASGVGAAFINGFAKQIGGVATITSGDGATVTVHFTPKFASDRETS